ncbi:hypothetical protein LTR65_000654 [Meristemomyces frigidus]
MKHDEKKAMTENGAVAQETRKKRALPPHPTMKHVADAGVAAGITATTNTATKKNSNVSGNPATTTLTRPMPGSFLTGTAAGKSKAWDERTLTAQDETNRGDVAEPQAKEC